MLGFAGGALADFVFDAAKKHRIPIALKVMDGDFAQQHKERLCQLAEDKTLSLLIGNHENLPALMGAPSLQGTFDALKDLPCDTLLTANKEGAYFISGGEAQHYPIEPVPNPKNTTGAGDQFLAGFLLGQLDGKPVAECMAFGASCAKTILMHDTARPPLASKHSIRF